MTQVPVEEVAPQFARLIEVIRTGEEVILTQNSRPVARLVPLECAEDEICDRREPGSAKGLIAYMADDFDRPIEDFAEYM